MKARVANTAQTETAREESRVSRQRVAGLAVTGHPRPRFFTRVVELCGCHNLSAVRDVLQGLRTGHTQRYTHGAAREASLPHVLLVRVDEHVLPSLLNQSLADCAHCYFPTGVNIRHLVRI